MSAQTEIENLRTLQQSLSDLVEDYNEMSPIISEAEEITSEIIGGKNLIVEAINEKGVSVTEDMSMGELAEAITEIDSTYREISSEEISAITQRVINS